MMSWCADRRPTTFAVAVLLVVLYAPTSQAVDEIRIFRESQGAAWHAFRVHLDEGAVVTMHFGVRVLNYPKDELNLSAGTVIQQCLPAFSCGSAEHSPGFYGAKYHRNSWFVVVNESVAGVGVDKRQPGPTVEPWNRDREGSLFVTWNGFEGDVRFVFMTGAEATGPYASYVWMNITGPAAILGETGGSETIYRSADANEEVGAKAGLAVRGGFARAHYNGTMSFDIENRAYWWYLTADCVCRITGAPRESTNGWEYIRGLRQSRNEDPGPRSIEYFASTWAETDPTQYTGLYYGTQAQSAFLLASDVVNP